MDVEVVGAVLVAFVLLVVGSLVGAGLTLLAVRRQKRLDAAKEREIRSEMADEVSGRVAEVLEQVMTRFESLEERLEFSERLMLERGKGLPPDEDSSRGS